MLFTCDIYIKVGFMRRHLVLEATGAPAATLLLHTHADLSLHATSAAPSTGRRKAFWEN